MLLAARLGWRRHALQRVCHALLAARLNAHRQRQESGRGGLTGGEGCKETQGGAQKLLAHRLHGTDAGGQQAQRGGVHRQHGKGVWTHRRQQLGTYLLWQVRAAGHHPRLPQRRLRGRGGGGGRVAAAQQAGSRVRWPRCRQHVYQACNLGVHEAAAPQALCMPLQQHRQARRIAHAVPPLQHHVVVPHVLHVKPQHRAGVVPEEVQHGGQGVAVWQQAHAARHRRQAWGGRWHLLKRRNGGQRRGVVSHGQRVQHGAVSPSVTAAQRALLQLRQGGATGGCSGASARGTAAGGADGRNLCRRAAVIIRPLALALKQPSPRPVCRRAPELVQGMHGGQRQVAYINFAATSTAATAAAATATATATHRSNAWQGRDGTRDLAHYHGV